MFCQNCGREVSVGDGARFCPKRGSELEQDLRQKQVSQLGETANNAIKSWLTFYNVVLHIMWVISMLGGAMIGAHLFGTTGGVICAIVGFFIGSCVLGRGMILLYTAENIANTTDNTNSMVGKS